MAWQDAKYNVDPPASAGNGTLLNAEARLSRNFDHATDEAQKKGKRVFTFVVDNGYVTDIPKYCVDSKQTILSNDKKTLSCEYEADATHGVASRFLIPVTVNGPADALVTAKITDDADKSATVKAVKVVAGEGLNPLVSTQNDTVAFYSGRDGGLFVAQLLSAPNSRKPAGPVTFDMKINWTGSGKMPDIVDASAIQFRPNASPSRTSPNRGIDTYNDLNGATWKATVDPGDPWLFHVTVDGFNEPDSRHRNYTNKESAEGWLNLSSALVVLPYKTSTTTEQKRNWGSGTAEITLSNISYTTADGMVVSDPVVADQNTQDNMTRITYTSGQKRSYTLLRGVAMGNYGAASASEGPEILTASPSSFWDGAGVTVPGGVAIGRTAITSPARPLSFCNILPKGQGAHFTGEWYLTNEIPADALVGDPRKLDSLRYLMQWDGLPDGLGKDTSASVEASRAFQALPPGVTSGTLEYYVGNTSLDFDADCNGTEGWTAVKPADMKTVSGIRLVNFDKIEVSPDILTSATHFGTVYQVDENTAANTPIWSSGSSSLGDSQTMTPVSPRPTDSVIAPYPDAPDGYKGTNGGIDRFSVLPSLARNAIVIFSENQNPEPKANVPVTIRWGVYGAKTKDFPGKLTVTLPAGTTYVAGSASTELGEPSVKGQTLTWDKVTKGNVYAQGSFEVVAGGSSGAKTLSSSYVIDPVAGGAGSDAELIKRLTARSSTRYVLTSSADTIVTVTAPETFAVNSYTGKVSFDIKTQNDDSVAQGYVSTLTVLPYVGDGRGTDLKSAGAKFTCEKVTPAEGAEVYYSTADPAGIDRSPLAASNGAVAAPGAGWTKLTGVDVPSGAKALWFINKNVPAGIELDHSVQCTYTGDKTVNPNGAKFGFSAVSAAASTKLKTIEASDSTVVAPGSPIKVDKAWENDPIGEDGLVHFNGKVKIAEGNGATNLTITDDGGKGLTNVKLTKVEATAGTYNIQKVAENQWKVAGHVSPVAEFTYEGTAELEDGLVGPVDITNAIRVSSDENPKDSSQVCTPNTDVDSDTDQCDVVQTKISPKFAVKKSGGSAVELPAGADSFTQSYVVTVSNTGLVQGTSGVVSDKPGVVDGLTVTSLTVDGVKVTAGADGSFEVSPGVELAVGASKEFTVEVTYGVNLAGMSAASWKKLSTCDAGAGNAAGGAGSGLVNTVAMPGDAQGDEDGVSNNTACSTVTGTPGIAVVKKINGEDANDAPGVSVAPGSMMDVTFEVTNTGSLPLRGITVSDSVITDPKAITCPVKELAAGASTTCTAQLAAPAPGVQHTNTATATGTDPFDVVVSDDDPANATTPAFTVMKKAKSDAVKINGAAGARLTATFEISVSNTGLVEGVSSDVIDTIAVPAGLKVVDVRVDGKSVDAKAPFVAIPATQLAVGQTQAVSVVVTYEVVAKLSQEQWKSLSVCSTDKDGDATKGLFNSVTSAQDVTGNADNDACVPVLDTTKLAHTGAELFGSSLLATLLLVGGAGMVFTRRRA